MIFEFIIIFLLLFIILGLVYQFMYDLYFWILLLSLTFYICYVTVKLVFYYKKKKESGTTTPVQVPVTKIEPKPEIKIPIKKEDKDLEKLKEFINKNLKQGFKAEIIKEALLKQGWTKEKVEQAFK